MGKGGAARQYVNVVETLQLLREVDTDLTAQQSPFEPPLAEFIEVGDVLQQVLLDHVHRVARPGTHPDLLEVARTLQSWNASWQNLMSKVMATESS